MNKNCLTGWVFLTVFLVATNFAEAARLGLTGSEGEKIIDGTKQRMIEIKGIAEGGNFKDLRLHAKWKSTGKTESSPLLEGMTFSHTFPLGGTQNCGWVVFSASGKLSGVQFNSESREKYIDCHTPKVLIGKPVEGQLVKAGGSVPVELRLEDDALNEPGLNGLVGYQLTVDVDGQPAASPTFNLNSPVLQKFAVTLPRSSGRHGIRAKFTDLTQKTAEKTVWVNADGTPPTVSIISPADNQNISIPPGGISLITVMVAAADNGEIASGIDRVAFYLDGVGVAMAPSPKGPEGYVGTFGVPQPGRRVITVKAFDKVGHSAESSLNVNVVFEGRTAPLGPIPNKGRTVTK
jgi:hypothetical protein